MTNFTKDLSDARNSSGASPTTIYELDNGMQVVIREDHFAPVSAVQVWVEAGGADENDINAGVAHVHEHMLFKGTENRGLGQIAQEIESSGGNINAWTSWNETVYHVAVESRFTETALDVLADAVRFSSFDPAELDKELDVVMEEYKRGQDSPSRRIFYALFGTAFEEHPYRRPVIGTQQSIEGLTRDSILSFYEGFYAPNNMTLIVVGDVDTAAIKRVVDAKFSDFGSRQIDRPVRPIEPPQDGLRFSSDSMDIKEAHLAIGFHIPGANSEDAPLLDMVSFVLGGGETSRIYKRLVIDDQSATEASAFAYTPNDPGLFVVTSSLEVEDMTRAYDGIIEETARLLDDGITEEELSRARINLESDFVFRYETVQGQARELGYSITVHENPDYDEVYLKQIRGATAADLLRVARKYFTRDNMTVVTLQPTGSDAKLTEEAASVQAAALTATRDAPVETEDEQAAASSTVDDSAIDGPATSDKARAEPQLITLSNGARLIVAERPDIAVFSVRAAMFGGVLAESAETSGISNFTASMLSRGTDDLSREAFAEAVESIAGGLSGFSGYNSLGVSGSFLSSTYDEAAELFIDALTTPAFDSTEFDKAKRELLLAIKNREDEAARVAFDLAFETVYPDHPYGRPTLGSKDSVESLTAKNLATFYSRALDPRQLVIAVVGDVDTETVRNTIGRAAENLPLPKSPFSLPPEAELPTSVRTAGETIDRQQAHVLVAYPSVDIHDPDRYPLAVLDNILSGQSGRLFLELRDKRSLAYSVTAFFTKGLARGILGTYIATDPTNAGTALEGLLAELDRIRTEPVGEEELNRAKRYLIGSRAISLQTNGASAEDMAFNELYDLGYRAGRDWPDKISAVTVADVQRVAKKYLNPDIRSEVRVGPPANQ